MAGEITSDGCLIVISGPSGSGKGTILGLAMDGETSVFSISATTRKPRPGEVDGRDYFFVTDEKFNDMIDNGEFLEYAEVFGMSKYGTPKAAVMEKMQAGYDVYLDIDVQGALQVKESMPGAVLVFVLTPSMEVLEQRLRDRGTESEEAIGKRLATAKTEKAYAKDYNYIIINDNAQTAADDLKAIIRAEKRKTDRNTAIINNWR